MQLIAQSFLKATFLTVHCTSSGGIDPLLRGLIARPAKLNTQDHMLVTALRDKLFQFVVHMSMDLGSLNMERGREHGLPGITTLSDPLFEFYFLGIYVS